MWKGRRGEEMIRIDDERGEMWCSSSILSFREIGWEREARRAAPLRAISSESNPNSARTSNSSRFPGSGEKVMPGSRKQGLGHHFFT